MRHPSMGPTASKRRRLLQRQRGFQIDAAGMRLHLQDVAHLTDGQSRAPGPEGGVSLQHGLIAYRAVELGQTVGTPSASRRRVCRSNT